MMLCYTININLTKKVAFSRIWIKIRAIFFFYILEIEDKIRQISMEYLRNL